MALDLIRGGLTGSRTFVHEDIYDEFVAKATKLAQNKKLDNPLKEGCEQGPQVSAARLLLPAARMPRRF